jgi:hypothetical protein
MLLFLYLQHSNKGNLETFSNTSGRQVEIGGHYQVGCSGCTYGDVCGTSVLSCINCNIGNGGSQASAISNVNKHSVISNCSGNLTNGHCYYI